MLTYEELTYWLDYNPTTGLFTWKDCPTVTVNVGDVAGSKLLGYVAIGLNNKRYLGHVLAWFYMTKEWPNSRIDHKDGNRANNVWTNLRLATATLNGLNLQKPLATNTSGYLGVSWHKTRNVWVAHIRHNKKAIHLGCFTDKETAAEVVRKKRAELITLEEAKHINSKSS